jgi:type IV pilus assembly protein PilA
MLNNIKTKQKGFTIVELLIVIVVIAILAAISIVAYNGIQNRGKASAAKSAAAALQKKAEIYSTENSQYPNTVSVITGTGTQNSVTTTATDTWYAAQGSAFTTTASTTLTTSTTAPADPKTIYYVPSTTVGGCIYWWDYAAGTPAFKNMQVGTATCGLTGTAQTAVAI